MIEAGELNPGDWVNEALVATRLGVSRGPVREACRGLEQAGLLRVVVNRGAFVRDIGREEAAELYDLRAALFALAARTLAPRLTAAGVAALHDHVTAMDSAAAAQDLEAYYAANLAFHRGIVDQAGNRRLAEAYGRLVRELHLFRRRALVTAGRMAGSNQEHKAILAALEAGDAATAARLTESHVLQAKARLMDEPPSDTGRKPGPG